MYFLLWFHPELNAKHRTYFIWSGHLYLHTFMFHVTSFYFSPIDFLLTLAGKSAQIKKERKSPSLLFHGPYCKHCPCYFSNLYATWHNLILLLHWTLKMGSIKDMRIISYQLIYNFSYFFQVLIVYWWCLLERLFTFDWELSLCVVVGWSVYRICESVCMIWWVHIMLINL